MSRSAMTAFTGLCRGLQASMDTAGPSRARLTLSNALRTRFLVALVRPTRRYASTPFPTAKKKSFFSPINVLVMMVPFVTFGLGVWQVKRLRWKVDLIDDVQRNIEKEPLVLPSTINLNALPDFAFRRVLVKGKFEGPAMLLGPAVEQGTPGWNLVLPFSRASSGGTTILVNRGFITETRAKAIREGKEQPPGISGEEVVVEGMLTKMLEKGKSRWQPDNAPEKSEWYWKDVIGMSQWVSTEGREVQPVFVDAIDYGKTPITYLMHQGEPVGKPPTVEIRNQHATYAVIWFTLSAATGAMTIYLLRNATRAKKLRPSLRRP